MFCLYEKITNVNKTAYKWLEEFKRHRMSSFQ